MMIAYKLVKRRKDGSLGSLFINRKQIYSVNEWMYANDYPTKGFAHRPGFHCTWKPEAPHLSMKEDRIWVRVFIDDYFICPRPKNQGGVWVIANKIMIVNVLDNIS